MTHSPQSGPPCRVRAESDLLQPDRADRVPRRCRCDANRFQADQPGCTPSCERGRSGAPGPRCAADPLAWDALKRSLRDGEVRVENLGEQYSAFPTESLKPQPIPLRVKVVLIGDVTTYMLLYRLDDDFQKLFKVKAQFGHAVDRTSDAIQAYAAFINCQAQSGGLLPFGSGAVARVIEHGTRIAEHQGRLTTRFNAIAELVTEADHRARQARADRVAAEHVDAAVAEQERRVNLVEEEVQRFIEEGTIAIDVSSNAVGQVNGLSVMDMGDHAFARPSRITAMVGMGADGVMNIEREVRLSGPTHTQQGRPHPERLPAGQVRAQAAADTIRTPGFRAGVQRSRRRQRIERGVVRAPLQSCGSAHQTGHCSDGLSESVG